MLKTLTVSQRNKMKINPKNWEVTFRVYENDILKGLYVYFMDQPIVDGVFLDEGEYQIIDRLEFKKL